MNANSAAVAAPLPPGSTLGAYHILEFVAAGGMGMVYKARHRVTNELRALKVILPEFANDELFVARFLREVKIAAAVVHNNLVETYEPGMEGQTVFLPMELLNGETLAEKLQRVAKLDCEEALRVMVPVCDAVSAVHARDILHRDLKPANIFLHRPPVGNTVPKVLDFGAARQLDTPDEATRSGTIIGTVFYMAPEQAAGARVLDAAVDQWAIAVMLYQMLTGRRPYENDDRETALAKLIAGRPYPKPRELDPGLPRALEAVIMRALDRDPRKRFHSVAAFGDSLRRSLDDEHTSMQLVSSDVSSPSMPPPAGADGSARRGRAESRTVPGAVIELTTKKDAIAPSNRWAPIGALVLAAAVVGLAVMGRRSHAGPDESARAGASAEVHVEQRAAVVEPSTSASATAAVVVPSAAPTVASLAAPSAEPSGAPSAVPSAEPSAGAVLAPTVVASASAPGPEAADAGAHRRHRSDEDQSHVVVRFGPGSPSAAPAAAAAAAAPNSPLENGAFRPLVFTPHPPPSLVPTPAPTPTPTPTPTPSS